MNTRRKRHRTSSSSSSPPAKESHSCPTINNSNQDDDAPEDKRNFGSSSRSVGEYRLETLPPEVLEMILRMLPLGDVAGSIRLVSRRCSTIATAVLNGSFIAAGTRLEATMSNIETTRMSRATTELDLLIWSRAFNVLELVKSQYKMLKAVTWRYTHPPKTANFHRLCFYAGSLLDELNDIIDLARTRPRALSVFASSNATSSNENQPGVGAAAAAGYEEIVTSPFTSPRLVSFVATCKRFMNYFEKVSECKVNRSALISGCKAIDVLDCLAVGREVTGFRISSERIRGTRSTGETSILGASSSSSGAINPETTRFGRTNVGGGSIVTMRLRYVMRRAWFTCLQVPCAPDENSWREDQRFMYLRLRRLVGSVNEHYFEKSHFERDLLLRASSSIVVDRGGAAVRRGAGIGPRVGGPRTPRPPPASTYSGYGVYAGRFFYYGNMNKYAYESKFKDLGGDDGGATSSDESGQDDEGIDDDEDDETENHNAVIASRRGPPAFDLVIRVELRCSSELAPLAVISSLRTCELDDPQTSINSNCSNNERTNASSTCQEMNNCQENSELYFKLNVTCPASAANRLPGNFTWEQRGPAHSRRKSSVQQQRFSH